MNKNLSLTGILSLKPKGKGLQLRLAFTLVELIVVITILAILGTIAFISLQGYSKDTRNSVRLSDLSNIDKMLGIKMVTVGKVPFPDDYVEITASGTVLNYQGEAGAKVLDTLGVFNGGKDPKDETYYTYSTDLTRTKYQLLGFLEGDTIANLNIVDDTFAVKDLLSRQLKTYGEDIGILLDGTTNVSVITNVDVLNTTNTYKAIFKEENTQIEGTGSELFTHFYNRSKELLEDNTLAMYDKNLVGFWDFDSISGITVFDKSMYGNNGTLSGGILPTLIEGKNGNALNFTGSGYVLMGKNSLFDWGTGDGTVHTIFRTSTNFVGKYGELLVNGFGGVGGKRYNASIEINTGLCEFHLDDDSYGLKQVKSSTKCNDGEWHHFIGRRKGDNLSLFVDGKIVSEYTLPDNYQDINTGSGMGLQIGVSYNIIGGEWVYNHHFEGLIDEVRIFNRGLSDIEVEALYQATK